MIKQLQANQLAITDGLEKINETNERFLDMRELLTPEGDYQEPTTSQSAIEKPKKSITRYNIEAKFDNTDRMVLETMGYPRPNDFFETNTQRLKKYIIYDDVKNDTKTFAGEVAGLKRRKQRTEDEDDTIKLLQMQKNVLNKYRNILDIYLKTLELKVGEGIFYFNNHNQLLDRLELLGGSILVGNNGIIPEFSQIARLLNQMNVITKKQLNDLLKKLHNN